MYNSRRCFSAAIEDGTDQSRWRAFGRGGIFRVSCLLTQGWKLAYLPRSSYVIKLLSPIWEIISETRPEWASSMIWNDSMGFGIWYIFSSFAVKSFQGRAFPLNKRPNSIPMRLTGLTPGMLNLVMPLKGIRSINRSSSSLVRVHAQRGRMKGLQDIGSNFLPDI